MIAIGIDIGGTSIKGAAITDKGQVGNVFSMPMIKGEKGEETISKLIYLVKDYIEKENIADQIIGIGIGIPGTIDPINGVVLYSNNLKWENLPVIEPFSKVLPYPVRITNDANAATLGEYMFGAGKAYNNLVMITLGTGVGSGVVLDGKINEASELGHTVIKLNGRLCTCGRRGCLEAYASATALIKDTKKSMSKNKDSLMHKLAKQYGKVDGRVAFEAMKLGDVAAKKVVDNYIYYLGEGLCNICNAFRPDVIVLSGGVANQGESLLKPLNEYLEKNFYGYPKTPKVKLMQAKIGYDSGKIGAASLFFKK